MQLDMATKKKKKTGDDDDDEEPKKKIDENIFERDDIKKLPFEQD
jgi:hypothetical protein